MILQMLHPMSLRFQCRSSSWSLSVVQCSSQLWLSRPSCVWSTAAGETPGRGYTIQRPRVSCTRTYSKTSDSGLSEMGTVYNRPLYKGYCLRSQIFNLPIILIHLQPPRRGQPPYKLVQRTKQVNLYYCPQRVPCLEVPLCMYCCGDSVMSNTGMT